jgi:hypothetical protein
MQTDPTFTADLEASVSHVETVAAWLRTHAVEDVYVHPVQVRPEGEDPHAYADDGDITVGGNVRVEVKERRNIKFSAPDTYPYPTIIVDVAHRPISNFYIITTQDRDPDHALVIDGRTLPTWTRKTVYDRVKGRHREFWFAPRDVALSFADGVCGIKKLKFDS